jgi:hypothetical protein
LRARHDRNDVDLDEDGRMREIDDKDLDDKQDRVLNRQSTVDLPLIPQAALFDFLFDINLFQLAPKILF